MRAKYPYQVRSHASDAPMNSISQTEVQPPPEALTISQQRA
jgi:hypothetical protein